MKIVRVMNCSLTLPFDQEYGLYIPLDPFFMWVKLRQGVLLVEDERVR